MAAATLTKSELMALKLPTLQDMCGVKRLAQSGTKDALVDRLVQSSSSGNALAQGGEAIACPPCQSGGQLEHTWCLVGCLGAGVKRKLEDADDAEEEEDQGRRVSQRSA